MSGDVIVMLITITASLFLATRALRSHRLNSNQIALTAGIWVIIIALLAFALQRFAA
jgi:hypothetical protein